MDNSLKVILDNNQETNLRNYVYTLITNGINEAKQATGMNKQWLKKNEACKYVGVSYNTFNKWCLSGLPSHVHEGSTLFYKSEIDQWLLADH